MSSEKEDVYKNGSRPILCLDFDGVLHSYSSGWQGPDVIPDPPVPWAKEFCEEAVKHFDVCVFSSRSHQKNGGGIVAMVDYLKKHGFPVFQMRFPSFKPAAFVSIDDRAITFQGEFPDPKSLLSFKPWNKKEV